MIKPTQKTAAAACEQMQQLDTEERDKLRVMIGHEQHNGWTSPEIEQAWQEKVQLRIRPLKSGAVHAIPAGDVLREAPQRAVSLHKWT